MSLIHRRMALFASSSLTAAGLLAVAALAPSTALAQTCSPDPVAVAASGADDTVVCTLGLYASGVTYSTNGDLAVTTTVDAAEWGGSGIVLNGTGDDNITFNSVSPVSGGPTTAREIEGRSLVGALLDITTQTGDIDILVEEVDADAHTATGVTHAIRARSTSGDISIASSGVGSAAGRIDASAGATGSTGIEAVTGGAGSIDITIADLTSNTVNMGVQGRLWGIRAQTGSGDLTINAHRRVAATAAGGVGIAATTGAGALTVNVEGIARVGGMGGAAATVGATSGSGILSNPGGDAVINIGTNAVATGIWGLDLLVPTATTTTVNIASYAQDYDTNNDGRVDRIRASGGGALVVNNDGELWETVDFSSMNQGVTLNILFEGVWYVDAEGHDGFGSPPPVSTSRFSQSGSDVLTTAPGDGTAPGGIVFLGAYRSGDDLDPTQIIDFGEGVDDEDRFENGGYLIVNPNTREPGNDAVGETYFEGESRLVGLETFVNSGTILLGGIHLGENDINTQSTVQLGLGGDFRTDDLFTDGVYDDVLSMPGTRFIGDGGQIVFDADVSRTQTNCTDRDPVTLSLAAADCLMLTGGSTEGVTYVVLRESLPGDRAGPNPEGILLVDVSGGTSAQGHFVISPDTRGYNPALGGVLDEGAFAYVIAYNEAKQQHILVGVPSGGGLQFPLIASAAQGLWRTSTGSWFERQADLRGDLDEGVGGGVWLRVSGEAADRDVLQPVVGGGQTFEWDNTHTQTSYAVTGGIDLLSGVGGDAAYAVGLMAGYANAELEYEASPNIASLDGFTAGAYASFLSGGFYVDAAVNANRLILKDDAPGMLLFPAGTILDTMLIQAGAQIEAGWRFPVVETAFVEPLASVSYVRSKYDDIDIPADDPARPGIGASFDDPVSLRAAIGGRVGMDQDYGPVRAQFSLLGRVWNEFEGENTVVLMAPSGNVPVVDDFSGQFNEFAVGASIWSPGGIVSGFASFGGKFADDYNARTGSVGVRVNW